MGWEGLKYVSNFVKRSFHVVDTVMDQLLVQVIGSISLAFVVMSLRPRR